MKVNTLEEAFASRQTPIHHSILAHEDCIHSSSNCSLLLKCSIRSLFPFLKDV